MLKEEALTPMVTNNALPAITNNANASPTYETPMAKEKMKEDELVNDKIASKKEDGKGTEDDKVGFWDKNKKWLKPVAIGVGGISLLAIGIKL